LSTYSLNGDSNRNVIVTGGAGFIGRNLVEHLLFRGYRVIVIDNYSTGFEAFLKGLDVELISEDIKNPKITTNQIFEGTKRIYHLAADIDNRKSWEVPYNSFESNSLGTLNIALAAKNFNVPEFVYASSATVYGEHLTAPYFETQDSSLQTSLYGATKYSGESILSAFAFHFPMKVSVFRFGNVLGPYCTHGHLFDFVGRLRNGDRKLDVLGDGNQLKTFVHVQDVVRALVDISGQSGFEVFNLSRPDYSTVKDSVRWLGEVLNTELLVNYGDSPVGWLGDNPRLFLNTDKVASLGWTPEFGIEKAVKDTVTWLLENQWVYEN
jgi:UDP-glucose 4-epimerase